MLLDAVPRQQQARQQVIGVALRVIDLVGQTLQRTQAQLQLAGQLYPLMVAPAAFVDGPFHQPHASTQVAGTDQQLEPDETDRLYVAQLRFQPGREDHLVAHINIFQPQFQALRCGQGSIGPKRVMADTGGGGRDKGDHQFVTVFGGAAVACGQQVHRATQAARLLAAAQAYAIGQLYGLHAGIQDAAAGYAFSEARGQQQALLCNR